MKIRWGLRQQWVGCTEGTIRRRDQEGRSTEQPESKRDGQSLPTLSPSNFTIAEHMQIVYLEADI